ASPAARARGKEVRLGLASRRPRMGPAEASHLELRPATPLSQRPDQDARSAQAHAAALGAYRLLDVRRSRSGGGLVYRFRADAAGRQAEIGTRPFQGLWRYGQGILGKAVRPEALWQRPGFLILEASAQPLVEADGRRAAEHRFCPLPVVNGTAGHDLQFSARWRKRCTLEPRQSQPPENLGREC